MNTTQRDFPPEDLVAGQKVRAPTGETVILKTAHGSVWEATDGKTYPAHQLQPLPTFGEGIAGSSGADLTTRGDGPAGLIGASS